MILTSLRMEEDRAELMPHDMFTQLNMSYRCTTLNLYFNYCFQFFSFSDLEITLTHPRERTESFALGKDTVIQNSDRLHKITFIILGLSVKSNPNQLCVCGT